MVKIFLDDINFKFKSNNDFSIDYCFLFIDNGVLGCLGLWKKVKKEKGGMR